MLLYRPVGLKEMALIFDAECEAFPPRLAEQPIFYPVLNLKYAEQIAREWNTKGSDFAGYVTRFEVSQEYAKKFEPHVVGGSVHRELSIPAEELDSFNQNILGKIEIEAAYFGEGFRGYVPEGFGMKDKNADEQMVMLEATLRYSGMDFYCEIGANSKAVYLNYPYWTQSDFSEKGLTKEQTVEVLEAIRKVWAEVLPEIRLHG